MDKEKPSYYAIIPADVRYDNKLCANAKLLYGEITALSNKNGYCWATNQYFAELYGVSKSAVSKWVSSLSKYGYIKVKIQYKEGSKEIEYRYISLLAEGVGNNYDTPIVKKTKDNSTSINNTSTNKKKRKKSVWVKENPPAFEELQQYAVERKLSLNVRFFYNFFTDGNWIDSNGKKVCNWKQKMLTWESMSKEGKKNNIAPPKYFTETDSYA